jgi:hypothetical protein
MKTAKYSQKKYFIWLISERGSPHTDEWRYAMPCVGNLTEEKSCVSMSEFPTGVLLPESSSKQNLIAPNYNVTWCVCDDDAPLFPTQIEYRKSAACVTCSSALSKGHPLPPQQREKQVATVSTTVRLWNLTWVTSHPHELLRWDSF